jgi:hypothetical protein
MRCKKSVFWGVFTCCALLTCAISSAEEKTAVADAKNTVQETQKQDTEANKALDKPLTLEGDEIEFVDLLKKAKEMGVQFVVNMDAIEVEEEISMKVKDIPLREVLDIAAKSVGLKMIVTKSGVITFISDPEQIAGKQAKAQQRMFDRFKNMRGGMGRPPEEGEVREGKGKARGNRNKNQEEAQPENNQPEEPNNNAGVF